MCDKFISNIYEGFISIGVTYCIYGQLESKQDRFLSNMCVKDIQIHCGLETKELQCYDTSELISCHFLKLNHG